jgi:hypothetical protein
MMVRKPQRLETAGLRGRRRRVATKRVGVASLVCLAAAIAMSIGGVASASTMTVADPVHDNGAAFDGRGDVVQVSVTNDTPDVTLSLTTAVFDDPSTSSSWLSGSTGIVFNIDTDNDHQAEFFASFGNSGLGPYAVVVSVATGSLACSGDPSWNAAANSYTVVIPSSCLGSAPAIDVSASFDYFDEQFNESYDDTAYTDPALLPTTTTTTASAATTSTAAPTTTVPAPTSTTAPEAVTTTTTDPTTTTTAPEAVTTTTTDPAPTTTAPCKPGNGWGDDNHTHCGAASSGASPKKKG